MQPNTLFGPVGQIGYVVEDLEASARRWFEATGIGPWTVMPSVPLDHFTYNGEPSSVDIGIAVAYTGGVQIELIVQNNDVPSMYRELSDTYGFGVQHVCSIHRTTTQRWRTRSLPGARWARKDPSAGFGSRISVAPTAPCWSSAISPRPCISSAPDTSNERLRGMGPIPSASGKRAWSESAQDVSSTARRMGWTSSPRARSRSALDR